MSISCERPLLQAMPQEKAEFYQSHLDRVSRSFAFCIARLEGPLRAQVGLSYLLCRLLDTVEDAEWTAFEQQQRAFENFDSFIAEPPSAPAVELWVKAFPRGLPKGETILLKDAFQLFSDFHNLTQEMRLPLARSIRSMSAGMRHFMERKAKTGRLVLKNAVDVNRYCFFVAGLVGEILTNLRGSEPGSSFGRLKDAFGFGLFLQKVNLLKDQASDEQVGRFLVPSRSQLFHSVLQDADAAFRFLKALPEREKGFRLFCAWSLFLGLASLPWIQRANAESSAVKIPRDQTVALLGAVEARIDDNAQLSMLFHQLRPLASANALHNATAAEDALSDPHDGESTALVSLYQGDLPERDVLCVFAGA